jgi:hypothetical protein
VSSVLLRISLIHRSLPQTLLATYFCLVDILLAGQYAYYTRLKTKRSQKERQLLAETHANTGVDYGTAGINTGNGSGFSNLASGPTTPVIGATDFERSPLLRASRHSILSAELDVARAAERVERRRSQSARRKGVDQYISEHRASSQHHQYISEHRSSSQHHQHSSEHHPSSQHQPPSTAGTSHAWAGSESTQSSVLLSANDRESFRGRPRDRPTSDAIDVERGDMQQAYSRSISTSPQARLKQALPTSSAPATVKRTTSSGGQRPRAVGVVFMSVFLLAGIGRTSWKGIREGHGAGDVGSAGRGQVILPHGSNSNWAIPHPSERPTETDQHHVGSIIEVIGPHADKTYINIVTSTDPTPIGRHSSSAPDQAQHLPGTDKGDKPPTGSSHYQRIVGRVSAWVCTTLYLTSRLPQIWKNVSPVVCGVPMLLS